MLGLVIVCLPRVEHKDLFFYKNYPKVILKPVDHICWSFFNSVQWNSMQDYKRVKVRKWYKTFLNFYMNRYWSRLSLIFNSLSSLMCPCRWNPKPVLHKVYYHISDCSNLSWFYVALMWLQELNCINENQIHKHFHICFESPFMSLTRSTLPHL